MSLINQLEILDKSHPKIIKDRLDKFISFHMNGKIFISAIAVSEFKISGYAHFALTNNKLYIYFDNDSSCGYALFKRNSAMIIISKSLCNFLYENESIKIGDKFILRKSHNTDSKQLIEIVR